MIKITNINGVKIIISGLGRMLYQEGFPIGMAVIELERRGYLISWFHIADELIKHGWKDKTILSKLRYEITDSAIDFDFKLIEEFINSDYEKQREIIFNFLFESRENAIEWFNENY